ncbi:MAG: 3-deoxy-manno-octulosonate cytidylyltransferase [Endomicrobia bacterium]|nr:3-deoxy-manno-octulosonate cytidylyltransferase [Endomicrobiia bacterium]
MKKNKRFIDVLAVIPARYGSTRLPAKPLLLINNKPMIQWVYENVKKCKLIDKVVVATDDEIIFRTVKNFGGEVIMTSKKHLSGSDRVGEVARLIPSKIVLNVQGDEPMITPEILKEIIMKLNDKRIVVATPICRISYYSELFNPNFVKVVIDKCGYALYFSRSIIPYIRDVFKINNNKFLIEDKSKDLFKKYNFYRHIGVYGFKRKFLFKFLNLPQGNLERIEKLEQLRILECGYRVKTVLVKDSPISVDTKEDLEFVRKVLR